MWFPMTEESKSYICFFIYIIGCRRAVTIGFNFNYFYKNHYTLLITEYIAHMQYRALLKPVYANLQQSALLLHHF